MNNLLTKVIFIFNFLIFFKMWYTSFKLMQWPILLAFHGIYGGLNKNRSLQQTTVSLMHFSDRKMLYWAKTFTTAYLMDFNEYISTVVGYSNRTQRSWYTEAGPKWMTFRRWHFEIHFLVGILLYFEITITQKLVPKSTINNKPALFLIIAWHQTGHVHWCTYMS